MERKPLLIVEKMKVMKAIQMLGMLTTRQMDTSFDPSGLILFSVAKSKTGTT